MLHRKYYHWEHKIEEEEGFRSWMVRWLLTMRSRGGYAAGTMTVMV